MPLVLTIDQRRSRRGDVHASELARRLNYRHRPQIMRRFEVTVGDEIQGVLSADGALPDVLRTILSQGRWWIGIGMGELGELGSSARQSSGPAFFMAREAVTRAKKTPWGIAVEPDAGANQLINAALALWSTLLATRTDKGWEATQLREEGMAEPQIAKRLRITQQAVNQRLRAAYYPQDVAGSELIRGLLATYIGTDSP